VTTLNLAPGNANSTRLVKHLDPRLPEPGKPCGPRYPFKGVRANIVKVFEEVEFENDRWSLAPMARLNNVCNVHEVLSSRAAKDEPAWLSVDKPWYKIVETKRKGIYCGP
jgi:hypothetical protein